MIVNANMVAFVKYSFVERHYPYKNAKRIVVMISMAMLLCSFTQPAFYLKDNNEPEWSSIGAFFFGFFGPLACKSGIAWLANPCLVFAWVRMKANPMVSAIAAFVGVSLAMFFATCDTIMVDEAGYMGAITGLGAGYYFWVAAMGVCLVGGAVFYNLEMPKAASQINV